MSLSQFLELKESPAAGIVDVRRRARRRSRSARLLVLAGSVMPALLIFTLGVALPAANSNPSFGNTTVISGSLIPNGVGLPGGTIQTSHISSVGFCFLVFGLLLVIAGNVWSLVQNRRDEIPLLWPSGKRAFVIILGLVVLIASAAVSWFAS